jgi:hypothetical protein
VADLSTLDHMCGAANEDDDGQQWLHPEVAATVADRLTATLLRRLAENANCYTDETMLNEAAERIDPGEA